MQEDLLPERSAPSVEIEVLRAGGLGKRVSKDWRWAAIKLSSVALRSRCS